MAGGAPLPVREYANGDEMMTRYAEIRRRTYDIKEAVQAPTPSPPPPVPRIPPPDLKLTRSVFEAGRAKALAGRKPLNDLLRITCAATGVTAREITGITRTGQRVKARQIAMYLMVRMGNRSLPEVGRALGGRDHSTVHHGCKKLDAFIPRLGLSNCTDPVRVAEKLWDTDWSLFREAAR